tara:strand:- start:2172 stop:2624 length:453 start_codon:yes stop_codon:yes gene_type:complete
MNDKIIKSILKDLSKELKSSIQQILLYNKIKKSSDLYKSVEVKPTLTGFQVWANDYLEYIDSGRKPGAKKIPIKDLIRWLKKTGISKTNKGAKLINLAFIIQKSIYKKGIKSKNILKPIEKEMEAILEIRFEEEFLKAVEEDITKSLKTI